MPQLTDVSLITACFTDHPKMAPGTHRAGTGMCGALSSRAYSVSLWHTNLGFKAQVITTPWETCPSSGVLRVAYG